MLIFSKNNDLLLCVVREKGDILNWLLVTARCSKERFLFLLPQLVSVIQPQISLFSCPPVTFFFKRSGVES